MPHGKPLNSSASKQCTSYTERVNFTNLKGDILVTLHHIVVGKTKLICSDAFNANKS